MPGLGKDANFGVMINIILFPMVANQHTRHQATSKWAVSLVIADLPLRFVRVCMG